MKSMDDVSLIKCISKIFKTNLLKFRDYKIEISLNGIIIEKGDNRVLLIIK